MKERIKPALSTLTIDAPAVEYLQSRRAREKTTAAIWIAAVMFLLPLALMAALLICFYWGK